MGGDATSISFVTDSVGFSNCPVIEAQPALFVCTANSARSQLAAALWRAKTGHVGLSAGTNVAERVHPLARRAARDVGLSLEGERPQALATLTKRPRLVITVCDRAYESLDEAEASFHWSIPDPVGASTSRAFDDAIVALREWMTVVAGAKEST
jgi:protein-tyrosine-phosphatase